MAVTELGLRQTAEIYGASLIGLAALALAISGRLDEVAAGEGSPSPAAVSPRAEGSRG